MVGGKLEVGLAGGAALPRVYIPCGSAGPAAVGNSCSGAVEGATAAALGAGARIGGDLGGTGIGLIPDGYTGRELAL